MSGCLACGAGNAPGKLFCGDCGAPLPATCSACGDLVETGRRFCGGCGAPLGARAAAPGAPSTAVPEVAPIEPARPWPERRQVSVLFCDLVGFTPFAERRDPEDVREVLSG